MKPPVAVALIIVGGLLVTMPSISDHFERGQIVAAMAAQKFSSVTLNPPPMSSEYRFGCWFLGGIMVAMAVIFSRRSAESSGS